MPEVKKTDSQASENQEVEKKDQNASADQEGEVDYKAELEKVKVERDNYKQGMLNAKDQLKKKGIKKQEVEGEEDDSEDSEDIKAQVAEIVDAKLSDIKKTIDLNSFDSLIGSYSDNPDEQELIRYHFENSVGTVGTLRERIENAQLIANKKKFLKESSEMRRALENKSGISRNATAGGGNQDVEKGTKDFFSPEQIAHFKKRGFTDAQIEQVKANYLKNKQK